MHACIISDQPERQSFHQIEILAELMERKIHKKVDLLIFSQESLILNDEIRSKTLGFSHMFKELESIICEGLYSFYVISLEKSNSEKLLLSEDKNLLESISRYSPKSAIFLFAAQSIIDRLRGIDQDKELDLFLFRRRGVSKVSAEFKKQILTML